ncbi:TRAP transporter substrate-binding protein DctP [Grimontia sp. NTOU-MAR1]|uniref:TRAP transporter substrate-binding protein DctP n=1 Tax=Grimontia sp. NTOU-MAR1 TaxID=3111011 RepID=UPI002DB55FB7|nr:TRAP transporter substrate-binding protein DctP [Grimontia sp. NTOU-MAR1]WRW00775.1 TRAP transporter substrate-binding protein DctP [Grimontia sp. NTOU-MAR1]
MASFTKRIFSVLAVFTLLVPTAYAKEWRFNNFLPETRPETSELEQYAADVKTKTNGEIDIQVYSGGSLGLKNTDVLRFLPKGAVDMSLAWANYLGRDAEDLSTVMVQGTIGSIDELKAALPEVKAIYEEAFSDWDVVTTGYIALPMLQASIFCRKEPVNTLEQLRGKKLRVWAKDQVDTFRRLGISAQIIPQEEMYVAMKTGVVDCAVYPALYAHTVSLQEVSGYASYLYPMASGPYILGISRDKWESLSTAHQQALTEAGNALWERTNSYDDDHQKELAARAKLEQSNVKWLEDFPEEDRKEFVEAITQVWGELAEEAGGKAPEYRKRMLSALGRE